jgi:hypothetical protein
MALEWCAPVAIPIVVMIAALALHELEHALLGPHNPTAAGLPSVSARPRRNLAWRGALSSSRLPGAGWARSLQGPPHGGGPPGPHRCCRE